VVWRVCGTRGWYRFPTVADRGRNGEECRFGKIDGTLEALDKVVRKPVSKGGPLHFVYEAGPCGYEIYRHGTPSLEIRSIIILSIGKSKSGQFYLLTTSLSEKYRISPIYRGRMRR